MTSPTIDYPAIARALDESPDYRVLRRLQFREMFRSNEGKRRK